MNLEVKTTENAQEENKAETNQPDDGGDGSVQHASVVNHSFEGSQMDDKI